MIKQDQELIKKIIEVVLAAQIKEQVDSTIVRLTQERRFIVGQEYFPLLEMAQKYNLSKRSFYNFDNEGHIDLVSTGGRTMVSMIEFEEYLRKNKLKNRNNEKL